MVVEFNDMEPLVRWLEYELLLERKTIDARHHTLLNKYKIMLTDQLSVEDVNPSSQPSKGEPRRHDADYPSLRLEKHEAYQYPLEEAFDTGTRFDGVAVPRCEPQRGQSIELGQHIADGGELLCTMEETHATAAIHHELDMPCSVKKQLSHSSSAQSLAQSQQSLDSRSSSNYSCKNKLAIPSAISRRNSDLFRQGSQLSRIVLSKYFESFFACVIVANVIVMALESQYIGFGIGYEIQFDSYKEAKEEVWPGAKIVFDTVDYFFGVLYSIELALKIVVLQRAFFDRWNLFDATIVFTWYFDKALSAFPLPIDFRFFRLLRLLRLVRLAKTLAGFDELLLMFTAIQNSASMLAWTFLFLFSCQLIFALFLNQVLVEYYIRSEDVPLEKKARCFNYFGNFSRAIFSVYELTLANWPPIGRFLMDDISEFFVIFSIFYKMTFGFAVIAVINGCFIKETFKAVENDDFLMILSKEKEAKLHVGKMQMLLDAADTSGDGVLCLQEFVTACQTPAIKSWLAAQGLDAGDAEALFKLIDSENAEISIHTLVQGVKKLKGHARSLDVLTEVREARRREQVILKEIGDIKRVVARKGDFSDFDV